jgi:hypothetical protein
LKLLAIIFVLLILLLFIYGVTYQKHIVNEIKYKEQFVSPYKFDPTLNNPVLPAIDPGMVQKTLVDARRQSSASQAIKNNAISNLNQWKSFNNKREATHKSITDKINATGDGIKRYTGNLSKMNQSLYKMRNGDKFAKNDIDKVGTFDATLFL